jgi:hypothetical protein
MACLYTDHRVCTYEQHLSKRLIDHGNFNIASSYHHIYTIYSVALVRKRTIPTVRPPLVFIYAIKLVILSLLLLFLVKRIPHYRGRKRPLLPDGGGERRPEGSCE